MTWTYGSRQVSDPEAQRPLKISSRLVIETTVWHCACSFDALDAAVPDTYSGHTRFTLLGLIPSGNKIVQERAWLAARSTPINHTCCGKWRVREVGLDGGFAQSVSCVIWTQVKQRRGDLMEIRSSCRIVTLSMPQACSSNSKGRQSVSAHVHDSLVVLVDPRGMQKLNNMLRRADAMLREEPVVQIASGPLAHVCRREARWDDMNR